MQNDYKSGKISELSGINGYYAGKKSEKNPFDHIFFPKFCLGVGQTENCTPLLGGSLRPLYDLNVLN